METQLQQLKLNVTNIRSVLKNANKQNLSLRKSNAALISQENKQRRVKERESKVEKKISPSSSPLSAAKAIASPSMGLFDKVINFGALLLTGILFGALPGIYTKIEEFKKENKEVIDNVTTTLTSVKDGAMDIINAFTDEKDTSLDWFAKFNPNTSKLEGGFLYEVQKIFDSFGGIINDIDKFLGGEGKSGNYFITDPLKQSAGGGSASGASGSIANAPDLKTAIRIAESGDDYSSMYNRNRKTFSRGNEDITKMTIDQVDQLQTDYLNHQKSLGYGESQRSAAMGAYQMMRVRDVARSMNIDTSTTLFNKATQDRMADYYLNYAGYQQFMQGKITAEQFNDRLAGQFASIKTVSGRGVYDNDGMNSAYEDLLDLIRKTKRNPTINPRKEDLNKKAEALNNTVGEDGSTTIIVGTREVITGEKD